MKYHRLAFIDTETTGLDPNFHEVIEIGCVVADWKPDLFGERTLVESSTLDIKIIPEHIERADPKALAVNHYAKRDWSQAIQRRLRRCATAGVVPPPQKKSATTSPSLEEALMIRSRMPSGF